MLSPVRPSVHPPSPEFLESTGIPAHRLAKMDALLLAHFRDTFDTLSAFRRCCLCTRGDKVKLFRTVIKFCGQILEGGRRRAAPSKLQAIREWKHPSITTMTKLKSFLGLAQHYSQFVPRYATLAAPLTEQLKGGLKRKVVWDTDSIAAFEALKKELLENVVLDIADPSKPYVLETDASDYAVGAVLSQYNDNQELRPVAFFSRKLQGSPGKGQMGWSIREKETYAIVLVLLKFRSWLSCSSVHILVLTDHQSLKDWYNEDLNNMIGSVGRRGRWHEFFPSLTWKSFTFRGNTRSSQMPCHAGRTLPDWTPRMQLFMVTRRHWRILPCGIPWRMRMTSFARKMPPLCGLTRCSQKNCLFVPCSNRPHRPVGLFRRRLVQYI